ncbi:MAG: glycoside hydrolase family protein [Mariprofundaceae bacterium]|nr:glycoside hydrolase family protein [Mariprofundaceae bacterium]
MARLTNETGVDLIKKFEGLRTESYTDAVGIWTIGYGHTEGVKRGQRISEAKAGSFLRSDLNNAERAVERLVKVALNDNQFAVLVSFTFNLGSGRLASSTLLRNLNNGDYDGAPAQLNRWVKAGGATLPGLVKRRKAEGMLWSTNGAYTYSSDVQPKPEEEESSQKSLMIYDENRYIRFEVIASTGLNMRESPNKTARVLKVLPKQTMLYIGHHVGMWTSVDLNGNGELDGWVAEDYLSPVIR